MGAAAHEAVADRAQGLPRRVASLAERLKDARSNLAAQQREGSVPSGAGRADPSCGGPVVEAEHGVTRTPLRMVWKNSQRAGATAWTCCASRPERHHIYTTIYNLASILDFAGLAVLVEHVHGGTG
jgi:hypothetical protein